jgi:hypothetical protein
MYIGAGKKKGREEDISGLRKTLPPNRNLYRIYRIKIKTLPPMPKKKKKKTLL